MACGFESRHRYQKERHAFACLSFWVSPSGGRLHPSVLNLLGGNEFRLRQGFAFGKTLATAQKRRRPEGRYVLVSITVAMLQKKMRLTVSLFLGFAVRKTVDAGVYNWFHVRSSQCHWENPGGIDSFRGFHLPFSCNTPGKRVRRLLFLLHGNQIAVVLRFPRENVIVELLFPINIGDACLQVLNGFQ